MAGASAHCSTLTSGWGAAAGRSTKQAPPLVAGCVARRVPPKARTSCAEITSPRPSPAPAGLLVTKGSNRRGRMSARMPGPVSRHAQDRTLALDPRRDAKDATGRVLHGIDGVAHQVDEHAADRRVVGHHGQVGGSHVDLDAHAVRRSAPRRAAPARRRCCAAAEPAAPAARSCGRRPSAARSAAPAGRPCR